MPISLSITTYDIHKNIKTIQRNYTIFQSQKFY
jgi:hypothetical protein